MNTHQRGTELPQPVIGPVLQSQIRDQLDSILASDEFCPSRRASELLQHLVSRALSGDTSSLKERLLGVEIFHRRSDYDTSTDSIVRVTANDVRRRLAAFYAKNPTQPLRILLPLGSYVPDFIPAPEAELTSSLSAGPHTQSKHDPEIKPFLSPPLTAESVLPWPVPDSKQVRERGTRFRVFVYAFGLLLAGAAGYALRNATNPAAAQHDGAYAFYNDLLGPIGVASSGKTEIAITNPHVLLYHGLDNPGPKLGSSLTDIPVPPNMAAVLNKTANDNQADFPYHHFYVDMSNYTGLGEAKAAFALARTLQATGRTAQLTEERFLNWGTAREEHLVILGAPHESKFVQETLSKANFTIGYDSIHNAHPQAGEQADYTRSRDGVMLEDYGLIWMTQSPSGMRILVLAGLSSAGTAGVGEFFGNQERMWPVYQQLRAAAGAGGFPESWQVLLRIKARQDIPVSVTPIAVRITRGPQDR